MLVATGASLEGFKVEAGHASAHAARRLMPAVPARCRGTRGGTYRLIAKAIYRARRPAPTDGCGSGKRRVASVAVIDMATAERRDLLELLDGLSDAHWDAPTLCNGWAVRDVVAHVISYDEVGAAGLAEQAVQGALRLSKVNSIGVARLRDASPDVLRQAVARNLRPSGLTTAFGGRIALLDALIHHQDVRRSLGLSARIIPPERLRVALNFALWAPPIRGAWRTRGTRVVANDLNWTFGAGPGACGTGEAVLMVMAGRQGVAEDLVGPGALKLRSRIG